METTPSNDLPVPEFEPVAADPEKSKTPEREFRMCEKVFTADMPGVPSEIVAINREKRTVQVEMILFGVGARRHVDIPFEDLRHVDDQ